MKRALCLAAYAAIFWFSTTPTRGESDLDDLAPNANDTIRAVAVQTDGMNLLGGDLTSLSPNGGATVPRNRIARLDRAGTLDTAFNSNASTSGGNGFAAVTALATPTITITNVPAYGGNSGLLAGRVGGVDYLQHKVAPFIYVPGLGWYTKPTTAGPTVVIDSNGRWSADVTTGGPTTLDSRATIYGAWLVPLNSIVPLANGNYRVPVEMDAFPHDLVERYGPTVDFAGRTWAVKDSSVVDRPVPVGPGDVGHTNVFSPLTSDVWTDSAGLHLSIHQHDGYWWATEVTLLGAQLGYGTYWYRTAGRTDILDVNVTFGGGFIFDDYGDEESPDGSHNREIDVGEDSRWGVATDPNSQNVKQPFDYRPENRHRFNLPDLGSDPVLTRIMVWKPESLRFITLKGNYSPPAYPPEAVVNDYAYAHDPATGHYVPVPGRERVHFNLWLNKTVNGTGPSGGCPVEVVVGDFSFTQTPLPTPLPTPPPTPTPAPTPTLTPTRLGNISTRMRVETGDNVLIGGFIVTGTQPKKVIVRALGPSLNVSGVPVAGRLADTMLELHGPCGPIASNDNWRIGGQEQEIIASTLPPPNDLEAAIVAILPAGRAGYTAIVRGVSDGTGVGLVEIYDLDRAADSTLANISSRGFVQVGDNVMIGGFIVLGPDSQKVIVRAIGPSLAVPGALGDPTLELHDGNGALMASNNNWRSDQEAEIIATAIPPTNDLESAIVRNLTPGNYTPIVRGVNNTTGVALVEAYGLN